MKKIVSIIALLLLFFAASCKKNKSLTIKVGTWKTAQTIQPFFYSIFFDKKYKIEVFPFTNPADQKTALLSGSLDISGTTIAHAIHSASKGEPVVIVSALCNKCSALVVRNGSGIEKVSDLKGRKIGYVPGTMHEILLRELLTKNGLSPRTDVKLVRIDFFDMYNALAGKNIDAFLSGEPFPTLASIKGVGKILSYPYFNDTIGDINAGMLVTKGLIKNNPSLVLKLVKAHILATKYLARNEIEWLKKASSFGTNYNVLYLAKNNIKLSWLINADFIKKTKALGRRMLALGIIEREPDYDKMFDLSFVNEAIKSINE